MNVTSKCYDKSDTFYRVDIPFNVCGCMGASYGEPYCPCIMAERGLPLSKQHVEAVAEAKKQLDEYFATGTFVIK